MRNRGQIPIKLRNTNTCFAYVKLDRSIETNCSKNDKSVRWGGLNDPNAAAILSVVLAAQAQDMCVTFGGA